MDPANRARVEAWLRYGDNLGLSPFYRDRPCGQSSQPSMEQSVQPEVTAAAPSASDVAAAAPTRQIPAPASAPTPADPVFRFVSGPSLFEASLKMKRNSAHGVSSGFAVAPGSRHQHTRAFKGPSQMAKYTAGSK